MKSFGHFLVENFNDAERVAVDFINNITTSSRLGALPADQVIELLRQTVDNKPYTLYRGLALRNLSPADKRKWLATKPGAPVPDEMRLPNGEQICLHTTKSAAVAARYASGGDVALVIQMTVDPSQVFFDSTNLLRVFKPEDFRDGLLEYFDKDKEVLLFKEAVFDARFSAVKVNK